MPKVAIGMPVWNGEKFVSEAIESILAQTYGDFELVISDNASTDATGEICQGYAKQDARIRYIRQKTNIGAAPNYNAVFRHSSGQYFKWAADLWAPELIGECVRVLDEDESVVLCSPATALINEDGSRVAYSPEHKSMVDSYGVRWPVTPENNPLLMSADPADRYSAILLLMFFCLEVFGLMRRSAVERTSLHRPNVSGDKIFLAELSLIGRFHLLEQFLFYRTCHRQQFSATLSAGYQTMWFSGRKQHMFLQQLKILAAYSRIALSRELTPEQRYRCISAVWRRGVTRGRPWKRMFSPVN
jgi:glycosyltransferase involved in cell wall biosynthesis